MKKFAKIFSGIIVVSLLLTSCGHNPGDPPPSPDGQITNINLEGTPLVPQQVTIRAVARRSSMDVPYSEMPVLKEFEAETNVHVEWTELDSGAMEDAVNLMFSSGQLPDVFYGSTISNTQLIKYAEAGRIAPMGSLIEGYAPRLRAFLKERPDYAEAITFPDGNIYRITSLVEEARTENKCNMFINQRWLNILNLDAPATSEELYEVLRAFKTEDPNGNGLADEIPLCVSEHFYSIHTLFGMFGLPDNKETNHLSRKDGTVIFDPIQPAYQEAIAYFHKLYAEGLLDQEMFTQDQTKVRAKLSDEDDVVGMTILFWPDDAIPQSRQKYFSHLLPMTGPHGDRLALRSGDYSQQIENGFVITEDCAQKELVMRWGDYLSEEDNAMKALHGIEGDTWGYTSDGRWETYNEKELPAGLTFDQYRHTEAPGASSFYFIPADLADRRKLDPMNQAQHERYLAYKPYLQPKEDMIPNVFFSPAEQEELSVLLSDILDYVDSKRASWIINGGVEKEWDEYVRTVQQLGIERVVQIYQNAIDSKKG